VKKCISLALGAVVLGVAGEAYAAGHSSPADDAYDVADVRDAVDVRDPNAPPAPVPPSSAPEPGAPKSEAPPVAPPPDEAPGVAAPAPPPEADLEMHMSARPADMTTFAERSAHETKIGGVKARYSLNFFADTYASLSGGTGGQSTLTSFGVGGFSTLFTGEISEYIKATAEPDIEFDENNAPGIDLERLTIRAKTSGFWVEAGRSHSDLGYWNTAYHHGKWLQPTIERPRAVRFEDDGGILPIHWVGVQLGYTQFIKDMSLTGMVAVGNGRGAIVDNVQTGADKRSEKQGYAKLELKGLGHRDLRVGVVGLYGRISTQPVEIRPSLPDTAMNEYIGNIYVAFPSDPLLFIAEGYAIRHSAPIRSWETYDAFAVLSYAIPPVTPYLSVERLVMTNGLDPFFVPDPAQVPALDVAEGIAGLRVDVAGWSSVKVEYRLSRYVDQQVTTHTAIASWQFGL
jgi:hypothetical protein